MNILEKIERQKDKLSKSEQKVAEVILDQPEQIIHFTIAVLAEQAEVSEPTVNRFCRRLETKGFPDFKLQLAQCLAQAKGIPYVSRHVNKKDDAKEYTDKIFESTMANLEMAQKGLNPLNIEKSVNLLSNAAKISFFGLGASGIVANDAHNKFFRFNLPVVYFEDILMQRMSAINSQKGDVLVVISHTGRTRALVEIASLARAKQASVLGITAAGSPLAHQCDIVLSLDVAEDTDLYMPMSSRIAQLTLIDVLVTGFMLKKGSAFSERLRQTKLSLKESRFEPGWSEY